MTCPDCRDHLRRRADILRHVVAACHTVSRISLCMLVGGPYNEFVDFEAPVLFETRTAKKSWVMIPLSAYVLCIHRRQGVPSY
jgi:hypothetical protein